MEQHDEIQDLIAQSASGNAASFKLLYDQIVDKIYAYIKHRTAHNEDALDVTQETVIEVYKALPTFTYHSRAQFYAFVFTITKRRLAKFYTHKDMGAAQHATAFDENQPGYTETTTETATDVNRALAALDEVERDCIVLHHWSRYTFKEIAVMAGMQESAVRVRHHRALKKLSEILRS
jgi:RNA polymerase sigma-70 factor (ECF subfamily)